MKGISVIICCYNSAERLPKTLEYLSKQNAEGVSWEVIVVNNNSTDNTTEVAVKEWKNLRTEIPLRIAEEQKAGLSYARMRGAQVANYEYLIFCDDDNWLFSNYVKEAFHYMEVHSTVGVVGGEGIAYADQEFPAWFDLYKKDYAVGTQENCCKSYRIYGAGMILRKREFIDMFSSCPLLVSDREGTSLLSGGDHEICYRFRIKDFEIHFLSSLKFYHYIPKERISINYLKRLSYGMGYSSMALMPYFYFFKKEEKRNPYWLWIKDFLYLITQRLKAKDELRKHYLNGAICMLLSKRLDYAKNILLLNDYLSRRDQSDQGSNKVGDLLEKA